MIDCKVIFWFLKNDRWNYNFMPLAFDPNKHPVELGIPLDFYDEQHRSVHFLQFGNALSNEQELPIEDTLQ